MLYARWQFDDLPRPELAELGDALLALAAEEELEEITLRALERVWTNELEQDVRDCIAEIVELSRRSSTTRTWQRAPSSSSRRSTAESRLARRFIQQVALQYAHEGLPFMFCLCCLDLGVENRTGEGRRATALEAVAIAWADAGIGEPELRAAVRRSTLNPEALPVLLATDERRTAVRERLRRVARLGVVGVPHLSRELREILAEPMPDDARDDVVWSALCWSLVGATLAERRLQPVLN